MTPEKYMADIKTYKSKVELLIKDAQGDDLVRLQKRL